MSEEQRPQITAVDDTRGRARAHLNHHQSVSCALARQHCAVVGSLVGRRIEELEELRAAEVEHELRVQADLGPEAERRRVLLLVFGKFGTSDGMMGAWSRERSPLALRSLRASARSTHSRISERSTQRRMSATSSLSVR